jgi:hypothetical protein
MYLSCFFYSFSMFVYRLDIWSVCILMKLGLFLFRVGCDNNLACRIAMILKHINVNFYYMSLIRWDSVFLENVGHLMEWHLFRKCMLILYYKSLIWRFFFFLENASYLME